MIQKGKLYEYTGDGWLLLLDENKKVVDRLEKDDVFLVTRSESRISAWYPHTLIWLIKGERVLFCSLSDYVSQFFKEFK